MDAINCNFVVVVVREADHFPHVFVYNMNSLKFLLCALSVHG